MGKYSQRDLDVILEGLRKTARVHIRFLLPLLGGQPAGDPQLAAYCEHHLGLVPGTKEFDEAFKRIKAEEIGERDTTPAAGEVEEKKVYGINVIRRSGLGPWVAAHQVKALLKQAASRVGVFTSHKGSKGDIVEMGEVRACDASLQNPERPWELYLRKDGKAAITYFGTERGSVETPKGRKSIQYDAEHCEEGTELWFELRWSDKKFSREDLLKTIAAATSISLGSGLSLSHGKFEVVEMEVD